MIIGDGIVLGAGGESAKIQVTGVAQTDTVTCTKDGKSYKGKWISKPNPVYHGLPDGYTELEYIESTGTQMIKTGIVNTSPNISVSCNFEFTSITTKYPSIYGYMNGTPHTNRMFLQRATDGVFSACFGTMANMTIQAETGKKYETTLSYKNSTYSFILNGIEYTASISGTFSPSGNTKQIVLFNQDESYAVSNGTFANAKMYSCIIEIEDNIVRNYIPCKRNSDSSIGMYDLVNYTFYGNAGTGVFIAGAEVPSILEYWEFTVNSYGAYTVTATDGTKTATSDVVVDSAIEYAVEMEYKLWLYKDGDECIDVTGGWVVYTGDLTMTKNQTSLKITRNGSYGTIRPTNLISTIGYSTLKAQYSELSPPTGGFQILIYEEASPATSVKNEKIIGNASGEISLDVSGYQGNYYVGVGVAEYTQISGVLNRIWLE